MKKIDWIIHTVPLEGPEGFFNSHTHGMEKYGHLDFQLVLPLHPQLTAEILNTIGEEVQNGRKFKPGEYSKDVFTCEFRIKLYRESGRDVLRLIFPDPNMRFPEDPLCETSYKHQTVTVVEAYEH